MIEFPVTKLVCQHGFDFLRGALIQKSIIKDNVLGEVG